MARNDDDNDDKPKGKGGNRKGNVDIDLVKVRLSFPALFRPDERKNDEGKIVKKYKANFLLDKKKHAKQIEMIEDAIQKAKDEFWGDDQPRLKPDKICLRDGDQEDWDGYEGCMYLSASNSKRPQVCDQELDLLTEDDGKPYAGCNVNAALRIWVQDDKEYGKRINCSLEGVQFHSDGEPFGAKGIDVKKAFKRVESEDGDDDRGSRSRSRSRDDDDRGSRSRSRDDDDAPRSRRNRDDDDAPRGRNRDDDDAPRSRSRSRDDDDAPRSRSRSRDDDDAPRSRRNRDDDDLI